MMFHSFGFFVFIKRQDLFYQTIILEPNYLNSAHQYRMIMRIAQKRHMRPYLQPRNSNTGNLSETIIIRYFA